MADITFELLESIFVFRTGVRGGIENFMKTGLAKYAKLWSGRRHPLYRELEMADTLLSVRAPDDLNHLLLSASSMNLSGEPFSAEGADFRLEEINQQIQWCTLSNQCIAH